MDRRDLAYICNNLPVKPGILGKEENFFNSAVLITLVEVNGEYHFLFELRAKKIKQADEVCFPGGKFEPKVDNSYQDTAIRETMEELGILRKQIEIKGELGTIVAPMGATIDAFVAVLDISDLDEIIIEREEVAEVFTVPVSYFRDNSPEKYHARLEIQPSYKDVDGNEQIYLPSRELGLPERYHTPWGGKKYNIYVYRYNDKIIWGITAHLVREFVRLSC
ncbi:MAG: NUDIX hydrolase [Halanaerobiales bacterium]